MTTRRFHLATGVRNVATSVIGLTLACAVHSVLAADADPDKDKDKDKSSLEEIVVTGTLIRGLNAETALPVQILKADDIARTGATSTEDLLRTISAAAPGGSTTTAQGTGFL